MRLQDIPEDIEPQVGDIIEIEQGDVCFEVRIIGITADGYLCEQDNVQGAVLLEGVALDHDDVTDITGYIAEERVRLDPKCWKGKKIGNPKTKMKGGVRVNNCVPEGQEDIEEAGPFSYGYKKPRKGSVAYWAEKKRKEQEKGKPPIEPKNQMVGVAKVTKGVAEGMFGLDSKVKAKILNIVERLSDEYGMWDHKAQTFTPQGLETLKSILKFNEKYIKYALSLTHKDYEAEGVAEGYTGRETKDGTWRVFKDGQAVAVAGPFKSREEAAAWIKKHKQGVSEGWGFDHWGHDTWTDAQKEVARKKKNEKQRAQRQQNKDQQKSKQQGVSEAKSLKKRVRVVQGEHAGKTGWIREIKHGIHSTAPKRYYVDIDGGGQADNLPASALRLLKNQSDSQTGMAEGGHDDQFSLSGKMPATDRIPQDSTQHQDRQLAMVDKIKQQTIAYILNLRPEFERSDLELATTPELIQMLRDIQSGKMTEAEYQGRKVPLGKPMAGDVKKSKVYVRKPNGKVVKVNFGDKNMKIKKSNPKRRKSFRARHNCANPGPRWKARYWSCRAW